MKGKFIYFPVELLTKPHTGMVIANNWWMVHPEKGLVFYSQKKDGPPDLRSLSPQCNINKDVLAYSKNSVTNYDDFIVKKYDAVFLYNTLNQGYYTE